MKRYLVVLCFFAAFCQISIGGEEDSSSQEDGPNNALKQLEKNISSIWTYINGVRQKVVHDLHQLHKHQMEITNKLNAMFGLELEEIEEQMLHMDQSDHQHPPHEDHEHKEEHHDDHHHNEHHGEHHHGEEHSHGHHDGHHDDHHDGHHDDDHGEHHSEHHHGEDHHEEAHHGDDHHDDHHSHHSEEHHSKTDHDHDSGHTHDDHHSHHSEEHHSKTDHDHDSGHTHDATHTSHDHTHTSHDHTSHDHHESSDGSHEHQSHDHDGSDDEHKSENHSDSDHHKHDGHDDDHSADHTSNDTTHTEESHHKQHHHQDSHHGHHHHEDHNHHHHGHHHSHHTSQKHSSNYDFAVCVVGPNSALPLEKQQNITGKISLWQKKNGTTLHLHIKIKGFKMDGHGDHAEHQPGEDQPAVQHVHGIHVHQEGDLSNSCQSTGPHFNPTGVQHGGPSSPVRHVGDLGNIECDNHGVTNVVKTDEIASLHGEYSIIGKSIVIHERRDDFGTNPDIPASVSSGDAGSRIACCVINKVDRLSIGHSHGHHHHH